MQASPRQDVSELHYITPIANVASIFQLGILPHNEAAKICHEDISMDSVQRIRATKQIPTHLSQTVAVIHDCVNFYFNAKNPMLFKRKEQHESLCVLRIKPEVLDIPGVIVTDRNAAVNEVNFSTVQDGLPKLNLEFIKQEFWTSQTASPEENKERGQFRCAEVLIPNQKLHPSYIGGAYVSGVKADTAFRAVFGGAPPVSVTIAPRFFFQKVSYSIPNPTLPSLANRIYPIVQNFPVSPLVPVATTPIAIAAPVESPKENKKKRVSALTQDVVNEFFKVKREKPSEESSASETKTISEEKTEPSVSPRTSQNIPSNIKIIEGDLLRSNAHTLVNTVNCEGVMGKGIALRFKEVYPKMFEDYKIRCQNGEVKLGEPYIYVLSTGRIIMNFPTKQHWKNKSDIEGIRKGLALLVTKAKEWDLKSIAIPPLGCGNGWLNWDDVKPIMFEYLGKLEIPVELYIYSKMETDSPAKLVSSKGRFSHDSVPFAKVRADLFGLGKK